MSRQQTDNSEIRLKTKIRIDVAKYGDVVLDCFHGLGRLWDSVKPIKAVTVYGIEKEKNKGNGVWGDNVKFLKSMDLSKYDIIDLDSYGIPFPQLQEIFNNKTLRNCTIIYTFIQTMQGTVNKKLLENYGISNIMFQKVPTIFRKHGHSAFLNYLNQNGVSEVFEHHIIKGSSDKHYGFFKIKGISAPNKKEGTNEHNLHAKRKGKRVQPTIG